MYDLPGGVRILGDVKFELDAVDGVGSELVFAQQEKGSTTGAGVDERRGRAEEERGRGATRVVAGVGKRVLTRRGTRLARAGQDGLALWRDQREVALWARFLPFWGQ
jgi:hypothetical protein